uniref:EamA domain-containing protein n=1 Tax=Parascaris univalens TaxID=6257 RepID=A0A915BW07_PARUN
MWYYAIIAGCSAAFSAILAKLAFTDTSEVILFCIYIFGYIICNIFMWYMHTIAMRELSSSLKAVAINTATNFILTGVFGHIFFAEVHSVQWWFGISLIFCGAMTVIQSQEEKEKEG